MKITLFLILISFRLFSSNATSITAELNQKVWKELPFEDQTDFEEATCGWLAPLPNEGVIKNKEGDTVWNVAAYDFMQYDSLPPPTVNPSLDRQAKLVLKTGLFKVTEGIYQVRGADAANMTLIEGKTGIIVIDPLTTRETAAAALDLYFQNRPKKPIKAVIYTHSHVDHFGGVKGVISDSDVANGSVKVIAPEGFTQAALEENVMAGNVMTRRAMYMYGALLQPSYTGQMSIGLGIGVSKGEITFIPPTHFITKTGQKMTIDGVRFVFLMAPGSEAPSEMLFFLPEFKALCAAEDATHNMHNIYTLRGAKIRDAKAWAAYLNQAIDLFGDQTEVVFAQHHWPKWGHDKVIDFLEKQRDMFKFIHDQTLRFANQGYTMVEIGEMIKMPDSLAKEWYNRGYYGSLNHNAKSVYQFYLGWFNGNPSTLHALPEVNAAKKYVEYMGGEETLIRKATKDFAKGNYRWVAEVLNHLVYANPSHQKGKDLLADTLEQLGYQSENATWRNFYLTGAEELRCGVRPFPLPATNSPDVVAAMPIENFFDYLAIKLNGLKAADHPMIINFDLLDLDKCYLLQIKNGVLNYFPDKQSAEANMSLSISRADLNQVILGTTTLDSLVVAKKAALVGKWETFKIFQSLFDTFNPWFPIVTPH